MSSTLRREAGWLVVNTALLGSYLWLLAVIAGVGQLAIDRSMERLGELVGWAVFAPMYLIVYSPLAAVVLVPYRVLVRVAGRPRLMAFVLAGALTLLLVLFAPDREPLHLFVFGLGAGGYAAIVRLPGKVHDRSGIGSLNPVVRGAILGLVMSFVWIIGSLAAVGVAAYRARRGSLAEAGAIAIAGTLLPGLLLFFDLFREDVPSENYLVTSALLAGTAFGFALLGAAFIKRRSISPATG